MSRGSIRVKQAFVDLPEGQVHYRTAGEGPNLVLLHLTTSSSDGFSDIIPVLATKYRVIAMDRLGHGGSDELPDNIEMDYLVNAFVHFMDALKLDRAFILGQHTGTYEAIEFAIAQPERVEKLILVGLPDWSEEQRAQRMAEELPMPEYGSVPKMDGSHLKEEWDYRMDFAGNSLTTPEIMHRVVMASTLSTRSRRNISIAVAKHNINYRLPLLKVPTLFMCGELDHQMGSLDRQKSLLPPGVPAETAVIESAGNYAAMEKPQEFARLMMEFLEKP